MTAILVVNNLRDLESDARAGKRTLAVRLGAGPTRVYYAALLGLAFASAAALAAVGLAPRAALLPLLTAPLAWQLARAVARAAAAQGFNRHSRHRAARGALRALFAAGIAA